MAASDITIAESDTPFQKGQRNGEDRRHTTSDAHTKDKLNAVLRSPLAHPLMQLWDSLEFLVQTGQLQSVELELKHVDVPCFLLSISPELPLFYVELFLDDASLEQPLGEDPLGEDPLGEDPSSDELEGAPVCVLMNWLGSDTEPAYRQTGLCEADLGQTQMASRVAEFEEVLRHILIMTETKLSNPTELSTPVV